MLRLWAVLVAVIVTLESGPVLARGTHTAVISHYSWQPFVDIHPHPLFYRASGVAIAPDREIYVADAGSHRVDVYSGMGVPIRSIGTDVAGAKLFFHGPAGIATDSSGNMYVADDGVIKISSSGRFLAHWSAGVPPNPTGIAVDGNGNVYVSALHPLAHTTLSDKIQVVKLSPKGHPAWSAPYVVSFTGTPEEGAIGAAIAVTPQNSLVLSIIAQRFCHSCNGVYFKMQFISAKGKKTSENDNITAGGHSIAVSPNGLIYVTRRNEVLELSASGAPITSYGSPGCGPGKLGTVLQVASNRPGNFDATDSVPFGGVIHHYTKGTDTLLGNCPSPVSEFGQINSLAYGGNRIFVDDAVAGKIYRYNVSGKLVGSFYSNHVSTITADGHGNLYYAVGDGKLQKQSPQGKFLGQTAQGSLAAAAIASNGNLYVLTIWGQVMELPPIGHGHRPIHAWWLKGWSGKQGGNNPIGITIDSRGNIWVADNRHNNLQKFSSTGHLLLLFGRKGTGPRQFSTLGALAADGRDHVFSVDLHNNRIQEFNLKGRLIAIYGRRGNATGQLMNPRGIAVGSNGNIYVGDQANDRVQKLTWG